MKQVYFTDKNHVYTDGQQLYQSVSGLWKPYFGKFDADAISMKKAFKELEPSYYNKLKAIYGYESDDFLDNLIAQYDGNIDLISTQAKEYRDSWVQKAQTGTDIHTEKEKLDYELGYSVNPFDGKKYKTIKWERNSQYDNESYPGDLYKDLPDGYIPEHLVKLDQFRVAGQIDKCYIETVGDKRYVDIDDWKTDKMIEVKPTFFHPKAGYKKLLYPFDHIYNTNFWKYTLKISTYAYFLEQFGFTIRNLSITHIDLNSDELKETHYKMHYKRDEVKIVLDLFGESDYFL